MFSFLLPKHVRQGRDLIKDARKLLAYKRDLWGEVTIADFETHLRRLEGAVHARDARAIEEQARELDKLCAANLPPVRDAGMRENVEVFLVAIVIALGVRTYFLQPFTIPTGSMQPTLNGILGTATPEPPPNVLVRAFQLAALGRTWVNVVAERECTIVGVREFKSLLPFVERTPFLKFGFFSRTEIQTDRAGSYVVKQPSEAVSRYLLQPPGHLYQAGEPIARGYIDTGDHVFVDKFSYHFRKPQRAEVFVFNTEHVPTIENRRNPGGPSQFYIKRLGGLPGDQLRIAPPELFINGQPAQERRFRRVIDQKEPGYHGYSNGPEGGARFGILGDPEIPFTIPPKNYFALGDNSYHSSDSRDWGPVPEQNIMGHGVFVYWPFGAHWGLIR
ncbi:MAG: signal peptidase [Chthoniobacter sp.]|jgi:signal peptidase I|nr:signal peptidase [Chthoniobacter sp.]